MNPATKRREHVPNFDQPGDLHMRSVLSLLAMPLLALGLAFGAHAQAPAAKTPAQPSATSGATAATKARQLDISTRAQKVDFDAMLERRAIKFYLPYSRSLYFIDKGRERGISADVIREFERWVNKKYAKQLGKRPFTAFVVVATRDKLLADLQGGTPTSPSAISRSSTRC